ncbi:DNA translocase FtsK [Aneurinibacillus migulanus]|uniref:DNA translocase FtsK n=1 Tax=Aneurinibacillus migulanus TaxID=47500 RepID=UPI000695FD20|nr:DNA translocase FtsK [Aneurinibacillus migulanus]
MKEWVERFKQWLLAEENVKKKKEKRTKAYDETYEEEYEEFEPQIAPIPIANKHLTIRTTNIYPKRTVEQAIEQRKASERKRSERVLRREASQASPMPAKQRRRRDSNSFQFPLIPDELPTSERIQEREEEKQRKRSHEATDRVQPKKQQVSEQPPTPRAVRPAEGKRPFRPTEVISPIYGRKRPEQRVEEEQGEQALDTRVHPMSFKKAEEPLHKDIQDKEAVSFPTREQQPPVFEEMQVIPEYSVSTEKEIVFEKEEDKTEDMKEEVSLVVSAPSVTERFLPDRELTEWQDANEKEAVIVEDKSLPVSPHRTRQEEPVPTIQRENLSVSLAADFRQEERIVPSFPRPGIEEHAKMQRVSMEREEPTKWNGPSTTMPTSAVPVSGVYKKPGFSLLTSPPSVQIEDAEYVDQQQHVLASTLHNFNVNAEVIGAVRGPTVTRYEIQPAPGVKVNKITNLVDDIKLSLAARDIRIEAPIPGRSAVGIEVPNEQSMPVFLRSILESSVFQEASSPLTVALGMDIGGEPIVADLAKMPHGLIAGATGSGKSVCINSIILSLLYKATPDQVRLLLVDPKMVELAPYNRLPHLVAPVVTDPKQATAALKWAVHEMDSRYEKFAEAGARDISRYNDLMRRAFPDEKAYLMPSIVIIIDELADLMMVAPQDVEEAICRIAQKARACGIHLLVATQRPSVDVITGLIKANIPTRVAFSVSSQTDSRTILDMNGAERLLGRGDMLYLSSGSSKPVRLQGPYVSDDEIEAVTEYVRAQAEPNYLFEKEDLTQAMTSENTDELFSEVVLFCVEHGQASASLLQRNFQIGYNRAARLIDMMEEKGFISGQTGSSKPRDVFLTRTEYDNLFGGDSRRE